MSKLVIALSAAAQMLKIAPTTVNGEAALVDGVPVWALSAEGVITITPAADGLSAAFEKLVTGSVVVTVTADVDLGEGVKTISETLEIDIIADEATALNLGVV